MGTVHVRLDLERIRLNLEKSAGAPQTHEDVLRLIASLGLRRKDEAWFVGVEPVSRAFFEDEVLERMSNDATG